MIRCRSCDKPFPWLLVFQGKAVIRCGECQALNVLVSQGSTRVDVAGLANVTSA